MPHQKSVSPRKRKMRATPDSEIEIMEGSIIPPPKKKTSSTPTEQQSMVKFLPSVSLLDRIDALRGHAVPDTPGISAPTSPSRPRGKTLAAASTESATSPIRSSRVKIKTEKMVLLEAAKQAKSSPRKAKVTVGSPGDESDTPETPIVTRKAPNFTILSGDESDTPKTPPAARRVTRVATFVSSSDESDAPNTVSAGDTGMVFSSHKSDAPPLSIKAGVFSHDTPPSATEAQSQVSDDDILNTKTLASDAEDAMGSTPVDGNNKAVDNLSVRASSQVIDICSPPGSGRKYARRSPSAESDASDSTNSTTHRTNIGGNPDSISIPVMDRALQDPETYKMYIGLPHLNDICEVDVYGAGAPMENRIRLSVLRQVLSKRTLDVVLMGLLFVEADPYVNTARINPSKLATAGGASKTDSIKLRLTLSARKNENAVGVMIGMVTECFLVEEYTGTSNDKAFSFHKITINPFPQEYRRDVALWGQMLQFRRIVGSASAQGLSFHTRRKTGYTNNYQSPQTPQKGHKYYMTVSSPLTPRTGSSSNQTGGGYPTSRRFDEKIPIYDGRAKGARPFNFTVEDFNNLATWPTYRNGKADLPPNALVAIGYTLNLYSWPAGSASSQLSTNIQFVIFLGVPVA